MILRGVPFKNPDLPVEIRSRVKGKKGKAVFEVETPKDLLPWVESAIYFLLGLGQDLHRELRHSARAQYTEQIREENRQRKESLFRVYMALRIKKSLSHRQALQAIAREGRLQGSHWTTSDYASILPLEREIRAEVKRLRKTPEALPAVKKLKMWHYFKPRN